MTIETTITGIAKYNEPDYEAAMNRPRSKAVPLHSAEVKVEFESKYFDDDAMSLWAVVGGITTKRQIHWIGAALAYGLADAIDVWVRTPIEFNRVDDAELIVARGRDAVAFTVELPGASVRFVLPTFDNLDDITRMGASALKVIANEIRQSVEEYWQQSDQGEIEKMSDEISTRNRWYEGDNPMLVTGLRKLATAR